MRLSLTASSRSLLRRLTRYGVVVLAVLALVSALNAFGPSQAPSVVLRYQAPSGVLRVTLKDADQRLLHRTDFAPEADRVQEVTLAPGEYSVTLQTETAHDERRLLVAATTQDGQVFEIGAPGVKEP
ncbi:MAG: hypothetical protein EXR76_10830 [Myxococcales bacterium]|nr:hypothetical protein [Myxococcales bacterium]